MAIATVKYQYGTYSGTVTVSADENDDNETIIARAKAQMRRQGLFTLSMAYESFKVVSREGD